MSRNKFIILILIIVLSVSFFMYFQKTKNTSNSRFATEEIHPLIGDIRIVVSTTGVVEPQNRLEIKPPIGGRVEKILVKEGDRIKKADTLALMSSTERAALVDAARSQSKETLEYWQGVYKQTPIISPIEGEVIVRSVEPGQTVTTNEAILVLSDRLIVSAQFDETDIGRVKLKQEAAIVLDAYPNVKIKGVVDHIAYESELVNNVTIYDVDILPQDVPEFFRSGMSANVEVIEQERKDAMLIPTEAIDRQEGKAFVTVSEGSSKTPQQREIKIGLSDPRNTQILSGITTADTIIVQRHIYSRQKKSPGTNPFMPFRRKKK